MLCELCTENKLHLLNSQDFEKHIKNCSWCQEHAEWDARIMERAAKLPSPNAGDDLWKKIEAELSQQKDKKSSEPKSLNYKTWVIAASLFLAIVSSVLILFFQNTDTSHDILSAAAIIKVELNERSYINSIGELKKTADSKLSEFNTDLFLLYKDKLSTIDSQIRHCRDAIEKNPGNGHIRRYMLAALQDKKETLKEIINLNMGS